MYGNDLRPYKIHGVNLRPYKNPYHRWESKYHSNNIINNLNMVWSFGYVLQI